MQRWLSTPCGSYWNSYAWREPYLALNCGVNRAAPCPGVQTADLAEVLHHEVLGRVTAGGPEEGDLLARHGPALERVQDVTGAEVQVVYVLDVRTAACGGRAGAQRADRDQGHRRPARTWRLRPRSLPSRTFGFLPMERRPCSGHGLRGTTPAGISSLRTDRYDSYWCLLVSGSGRMEVLRISPGRRRRARRERGMPGTGKARSDRGAKRATPASSAALPKQGDFSTSAAAAAMAA